MISFNDIYQVFGRSSPDMALASCVPKGLFLAVNSVVEQDADQPVDKDCKGSIVTDFAGVTHHKEGGVSVEDLDPAEASPA